MPPFDITKAPVLRPLSALRQHALNWLHCYCMHNGCALCNHGMQTRVASYHACACTNMAQVSESRHGLWFWEPTESGCRSPYTAVHSSGFEVSQSSMRSNASQNKSAIVACRQALLFPSHYPFLHLLTLISYWLLLYPIFIFGVWHWYFC